MGWLHTKLTDLIKAFERKDWDTAKALLKEHDITIKEKLAEEERLGLMNAGRALNWYSTAISDIDKRINDGFQLGEGTKWPPNEMTRSEMLSVLKGAEVHILDFEEFLKKLLKKGKYLE